MKIQVDVKKVISALVTHRANHVIELAKATKAWSDKVESALVTLSTDLALDGIKVKTDNLTNYLHHRPVNNLVQYDKLIEMAGLSEDDTVELDTKSYSEIFEDQWSWRANSKFANESYFSE